MTSLTVDHFDCNCCVCPSIDVPHCLGLHNRPEKTFSNCVSHLQLTSSDLSFFVIFQFWVTTWLIMSAISHSIYIPTAAQKEGSNNASGNHTNHYDGRYQCSVSCSVWWSRVPSVGCRANSWIRERASICWTVTSGYRWRRPFCCNIRYNGIKQHTFDDLMECTLHVWSRTSSWIWIWRRSRSICHRRWTGSLGYWRWWSSYRGINFREIQNNDMCMDLVDPAACTEF